MSEHPSVPYRGQHLLYLSRLFHKFFVASKGSRSKARTQTADVFVTVYPCFEVRDVLRYISETIEPLYVEPDNTRFLRKVGSLGVEAYSEEYGLPVEGVSRRLENLRKLAGELGGLNLKASNLEG